MEAGGQPRIDEVPSASGGVRSRPEQARSRGVLLIYLAGALDGVSYSDGRDWYGVAATSAFPGAVLYCPGCAFLLQDAKGMDAANRAVIRVADAVLANLSGPGKALGTCREIEFARSQEKPVVVVSERLESLLAYDLVVVASFEEAWERLTQTRASRLRKAEDMWERCVG